MTEQQAILVKQNFHEEMLNLFKRTAKEVKYKPIRRLDLINKYGGYEAAIKILPTDSNTFDFTLLWENERLDLSIEALVTKERYKDLFPKEVADFCQKRLDEYNYAPKKLAPEPDDIDNFLDTFFTDLDLTKEAAPSPIPAPTHVEDIISHTITVDRWYELLNNQSIFTVSNRDLIVKIFALGKRGVTHEDLSTLEGYSASYPFYEVILALCKRIKSAIKIDSPQDTDGKIIWWFILFTGTTEDKKKFTWFLRQELRESIERLMDEGIIPMIIPTEIMTGLPIEEVKVKLEPVSDVKVHNNTQSILETIPKSVSEDTSESVLETIPKSVLEDTSEPVLEPIPESVLEDISEPVLEPIPESALEDTSEPVLKTIPKSVLEDTSESVLETVPTPSIDTTNTNHSVLWDSLKEQCIDYYGPVCELCGFDFGYTYGTMLDGFIHIHCTAPDKLKEPETINAQEDLIPICCNCEAVMMQHTPHYTANDVRNMIEKNRK